MSRERKDAERKFQATWLKLLSLVCNIPTITNVELIAILPYHPLIGVAPLFIVVEICLHCCYVLFISLLAKYTLCVLIFALFQMPISLLLGRF